MFSEEKRAVTCESPLEVQTKGKAPDLMKPTQVMLACAIFFITCLAFCSMSLDQNLLQYYEQFLHDAHRKELQHSLGYTLTPDIHGGSLRPENLDAVKKSVEVMFATLPKNRAGRISADVMRYMAHRYFSHKYSWVIKGFEPHHQGTNSSISDASILRSHLPEYSAKVLVGSLGNKGFSFDDAATLLGGIEQLIFDEVVGLTESAYHINHFQVNQKLSKDGMLDVVYSYLLEGMLQGNFSDAEQHRLDKQNVLDIYPNWPAAKLFIDDVVSQHAFEKKQTSSPYINTRGAQHKYSFEETAQLTTRISHEFGPWANYGCKTMKEGLSKLDTHGTGRVKVSDFWGIKVKKENEDQWNFAESVEYLQSLGALDESDSTLGAQVIIPNYVYSVANCIISTQHYSVCCLDDCENMMAQLESRLQKPEASTSEIMKVVEDLLPLSPFPAPGARQSFNASLRVRLEEIAANSEAGLVPIHGRLFAQWLHYAFPRDCPYPHEGGAINPMTPMEWAEAKGVAPDADDPTIATQAELEKMAEQPETLLPPSPHAGDKMWVVKEQLLISSTASDECMRMLVRSLAGMLLMTGLLVIIIKSLRHIRKFLLQDKGAAVHSFTPATV